MNVSYHTISGDAYLKIESYNLKDFVRLINSREIKNIVINQSWGYYLQDVEFLKDCPAIEKISVVGNEIDVSGIRYCSQLKTLYSNAAPVEKISFSLFPNLEVLSFTHSPHWIDLVTCEKITNLSFRKYASRNLEQLCNLKLLEELTIIESKIENLQHIESLTSLQNLHIAYCPKFIQIGSVAGNQGVKSICLEVCRNFRDFNNLVKFPNLISLRIEKTAIIKDVFFVEQLPKLQTLSITDVAIENGDIEILKKITNLTFDQKKHYSFKLRDFLMEKYNRSNPGT